MIFMSEELRCGAGDVLIWVQQTMESGDLDGKLIETCGTMSGGGWSVRKGGMILNSVGKKSNNKIATSTTNDNNNNNEEEDCPMLEAQAEECLNFLKQVKSRHREIADETRQLQKIIKQPKLNSHAAFQTWKNRVW